MDLSRKITTTARRGFGYITAVLSTLIAAACTTYAIFCVAAAIAILALHVLGVVGLVSPATLISSSTLLANISSTSFLRSIIQTSVAAASVQERIKLLGLLTVTLFNGLTAAHFFGITKKAFRFGFVIGEITGILIGNLAYGIVKAIASVINGIAQDAKESSIGVLKGIREVVVGLAKGGYKLVSSLANAVIVFGTSLVDFIKDVDGYNTDSIPSLDLFFEVGNNNKPGNGGGFGLFGIHNHNENNLYLENRVNLFLPLESIRTAQSVPLATVVEPPALNAGNNDQQQEVDSNPHTYSF